MSFLNIGEAADLLRVTKSTVYAWVHQKRIPHRKHGGKLVFSRIDLLDWSEGQKVQILGESGLGAV